MPPSKWGEGQRGVLPQRGGWDIFAGLIWVGMRVFGKMVGSRSPGRDAAQCSSTAASGCPPRGWPGPGAALGRARTCFSLVMLRRDMASGGPGHLAVRVDCPLWGGLCSDGGAGAPQRSCGRRERACGCCGPESEPGPRDRSAREGLQGGRGPLVCGGSDAVSIARRSVFLWIAHSFNHN